METDEQGALAAASMREDRVLKVVGGSGYILKKQALQMVGMVQMRIGEK